MTIGRASDPLFEAAELVRWQVEGIRSIWREIRLSNVGGVCNHLSGIGVLSAALAKLLLAIKESQRLLRPLRSRVCSQSGNCFRVLHDPHEVESDRGGRLFLRTRSTRVCDRYRHRYRWCRRLCMPRMPHTRRRLRRVLCTSTAAHRSRWCATRAPLSGDWSCFRRRAQPVTTGRIILYVKDTQKRKKLPIPIHTTQHRHTLIKAHTLLGPRCFEGIVFRQPPPRPRGPARAHAAGQGPDPRQTGVFWRLGQVEAERTQS